MTDLLAKESPAPKADLRVTYPKLSRPAPPPEPRMQPEKDEQTEVVVLPDPVGYHMLVALPTYAQQTASGIYIPEAVNERERAATVVGQVLAMGADCYKDTRKFPNGAWCKTGDTVLFGRYQGMRFKSKDEMTGDMVEYRMLSDDGIVGTVPEGAEVGGL